MKKKGFGIMMLVAFGVAAMLSGCSGGIVNSRNDVVTGGTSDHSDHLAPKVIQSDELVSIDTYFYRFADIIYDTERSYHFQMTKSEDGVFTITEGDDEALTCETDAAFADRLQQLIRDQDLIRLNGTQKQTHGLPPEFGPYRLRAEYASGESLYFSLNGDPNAHWTGAILDLFAKEFGNHGIEDLLPPKENSVMTRFKLEYTDGDMNYRYGEILVPMTEEEKARTLEDVATNGFVEDDCVKKAYSNPWDRSGKTSPKDKRRADVTKEYYGALQEIVEDTGLISFHNGEGFPVPYDYQNTPQYFAFYIEYAGGNRLMGFSDDPDTCEAFRPIAERFSAFYEDYLEKNHD